MDKHFYAAVSLGLGLALGIVGDIFFYRRLIGLSFPLFVLLSVAAFFAFAALARKQPQARNLWLLIPLGFFAAMVAVRADMTLTFLNVTAVLTLGALLLHYFLLREAFDLQSLTKHTFVLIDAGFAVAFAPITQLMDAAGLLRRRRKAGSHLVTAVLRGLLIATPVLIVFVLLLASADPIFARYVARDATRVVLQDASGQKWTVPVNDLAPDDQRMVESFPAVATLPEQ
ncbi:MAG: hypothetical protein HUU31_22825 [Anaerolineae bacterium]|nr:hypothetical protein [Anaerolineae bacterium]